MTNDDFEKGLRHLKRFLKENGCYIPVMRYLFYHGRTKEDLLNEFNNDRYAEIFRWNLLFLRLNLVGKVYYSNEWRDFGQLFYDTKLYIKWEKYCKDNNITY